MEKIACPVCRSVEVRPAWTLAGAEFMRCADCRCVFSGTPHDDAYWEKYYSSGYHEARGHGGIEEGVLRAKEATFEKFLGLLPPPGTASRLLEVGCGTGDALHVAERLGYEAAGIDISGEAIAVARRRFPGLTFVEGIVEKADWPDGSFDAVASLDMVEHVADPHPLADTVTRLLAPGGRLLIVTPNASSLSARLLGAKWFHSFPDHELLHSPRSLSILFERRGLKLVRRGFAWKRINLEMLFRHARAHEHIFGGRWIRGFLGRLPKGLRSRTFPFNIGEFFAVFEKPS